MVTALDRLLELHAALEGDLNTRLVELADREAEAQQIIQRCFDERKQIERERAGLKDAERIYREAFTAGGNIPPRVGTAGLVNVITPRPTVSGMGSGSEPDYPEQPALQSRARIGPQRFLMLDAINTLPQITIEDIANLTKLPARRVRDQMFSDTKLGVVSAFEGKFNLTPGGLDLLDRFKAYKRANGQALPVAGDPATAEDQDDTEGQVAVSTPRWAVGDQLATPFGEVRPPIPPYHGRIEE